MSPADASSSAAVRLTALASGAAAGAAGMGLQRLGLSGLELHHGAGAGGALALALWIGGWALGAWWAGWRSLRAGGGLLLAGVLVAGCAPLLVPGWGPGFPPAVPLLMGALAQGVFLPTLARVRGVHLHALWGLNLVAGIVALLGPAEFLAARLGAPGSALLVGALSLAAGTLGWRAGRTNSGEDRAADGEVGDLSPRLAATAVGLVTVWVLVLEASVLRLSSLDLGAMHRERTQALAAVVLAMGLGALVLPWLVRRRGLGLVLVLSALLASTWWLPPLHGLVTRRDLPPLMGALLLTMPLAPLGAAVPLVARRTVGERGRVLGTILLAEVFGALLAALPLTTVGWDLLGMHGVLAAGALCAGLAALLLRQRVPALALTATAILMASLGSPTLTTPALDRPEFDLLASGEDRNFAVTVVQDQVRAERTLLTDAFRATATGPDYAYMRALGHLPVLLHAAPRRAAVLAFGTGTTAGSVAAHPEVERLDLLELSGLVLEQAIHFESVNDGVLQDPRVHVQIGDGRRTLREAPATYDVLTMEPLLPDAPGAVHLYTEDFYALVREALAPGGILCQWVPPHALRPRTTQAVVAAFTSQFAWSGLFQFGSQWLLIGSDAEPGLRPSRFDVPPDLAARLAAIGLETAAGVAARFVASGASLSAVERPLLDRDPWIIHEPTIRDARVLGWLPENLAWARAHRSPMPARWAVALGGAGHARVEAVEAVRLAREAHEALRARDAGVASASGWAGRAQLEGGLERARRLSPAEPALAALDLLLASTSAEQRGLSFLAAGDYETALDALSRAAELRPELPAHHLALALAAEGQGNGALALTALDKALGLCPRLLETRRGEQILALGGARSSALLARARATLGAK